MVDDFLLDLISPSATQLEVSRECARLEKQLAVIGIIPSIADVDVGRYSCVQSDKVQRVPVDSTWVPVFILCRS